MARKSTFVAGECRLGECFVDSAPSSIPENGKKPSRLYMKIKGRGKKKGRTAFSFGRIAPAIPADPELSPSIGEGGSVDLRFASRYMKSTRHNSQVFGQSRRQHLGWGKQNGSNSRELIPAGAKHRTAVRQGAKETSLLRHRTKWRDSDGKGAI